MAFVENTQYPILAMHARHDRDAQINASGLVAQADGEPAILRDTGFGNIEFSQYLEPRDDLWRNLRAAHTADMLQHAVDAVADIQPAAA